MTPLILDLDTGIDDALAIAYALGSPDVRLLGIVGTYGNVTVDRGVRNSLAVTELLGHPEVPVYRGLAHAPGAGEYSPSAGTRRIHGDNGIGDVSIPEPTRGPEREPAVDFLIDAVRTYGRDLVYVPTGAMTTIAAALDRAPEIADEIGSIVMMGGALTVRGNVSPWAEANISQDPDSADRLLRSGAPVTMVGLDVTLRTLLTRRQTAQWRALGTPAGTFLADMTDFYIGAYGTIAPKLGGCGLHDPLAVAVALDPSLVETLAIPLTVDVDGPTRGRTIGDNDRLGDPSPSTRAAIGVDVPRFLTRFMERTTAVAS